MGQSELIEVICGGIQRDWCSTLGLESKVMAVRYSVSSANILCGIVVRFICFSSLSFILQHCPPLLLFHTWRTVPLALSSIGTIADVTNPVDALMYPFSATNSTRKSPPTPPLTGLCPCGPSGSQGPGASSWHGWRNWDSWDPWPSGLQPSHHHQQPIKTVSSTPKTHGNFSKFPTITPIIVSFLDTKQSSDPWFL